MAVHPRRDQTEVPDGARCQETFGWTGKDYIRCNAPATCVVDHGRDDESAYYMCAEHDNHNVSNRGARLVCGSVEPGPWVSEVPNYRKMVDDGAEKFLVDLKKGNAR